MPTTHAHRSGRHRAVLPGPLVRRRYSSSDRSRLPGIRLPDLRFAYCGGRPTCTVLLEYSVACVSTGPRRTRRFCKAVVFNTATRSQTGVALSGFLCTCQRPTPHHFSRRPAPTGLPVEGRQTISAPMPAVKDFLKKRSSRLPRPVRRRRIVTDSRHPSTRSHHRGWSYARQHVVAYAPSAVPRRNRTTESMVEDCD